MKKLDLLKQARDARVLAAKAKRLAQSLASPTDKERLACVVDERLEQATSLETRAAAPHGSSIY